MREACSGGTGATTPSEGGMIWNRLACRRRRTTVPRPGSLSMLMLPPCRSIVSATSASPRPPRPVGAFSRARLATSRECSSVIPIPVSRTSMTIQPDSSLATRMPSVPPSCIAWTALRMRRTRASRSSKAMPSTGGSASMSCVTVMTTPRRSASSRQRGAVRADDREPAVGGRILGRVAEEQLGVRQDGRERVVEIVRETAHGFAERAKVVALVEPPAALGHAAGDVAGPAPERQDGAIELRPCARHLARDVLYLFVVGEQQGILGRRRLGAPTDPLAEPLSDPSHAECVPGALEVDQLGYPLAMPRGVAEGEFRPLGPLEVEVQVVLPGEPDAAVELDASAGDPAVRVRDVGLGHADRELAFGHPFVHGPRGIVRDRLAVLDVHQHVRRLVLDALVGADGPAESLPDLRVLDRHLEHLLRAA